MQMMKRAEEIMIPMDRYPHVPYWFSLRQVMAIMENAEFNVDGKKSLPRFALVFDESYQLLGIIRRRDIFRGLEPQFLASEKITYRKKLFDVKVDPNLSEMSYDKLLRGVIEKAESVQARQVMREIKETVEHDDHIIKVIYEMVDNNVSLLPVVKDGQVVGVVRSVELFNEVYRILSE